MECRDEEGQTRSSGHHAHIVLVVIATALLFLATTSTRQGIVERDVAGKGGKHGGDAQKLAGRQAHDVAVPPEDRYTVGVVRRLPPGDLPRVLARIRVRSRAWREPLRVTGRQDNHAGRDVDPDCACAGRNRSIPDTGTDRRTGWTLLQRVPRPTAVPDSQHGWAEITMEGS